jgi:hypothetical protein
LVAFSRPKSFAKKAIQRDRRRAVVMENTART